MVAQCARYFTAAAAAVVVVVVLYLLMPVEWRMMLLFGSSRYTEDLILMGVSSKSGGCDRQQSCAFILSMGRAGSTALQDAMNQIPGVYIRGENNGMLKFLYNTNQIASQLTKRVSRASDPKGPDAEKMAYDTFVKEGNKPAWYSQFQPGVAECARTTYFKRLFGYGGFGEYIVGFKEIRHNSDLETLLALENTHPWTFRRRNGTLYSTYDKYLDFIRTLCVDTKIIFNLRRNYDYTAGQGFYKKKGDILLRNVQWMYRYAQAHKKIVHFVYYEDMFDGTKNGTVLKDLASFLHLDQRLVQNVSFTRLPKI